MNKYDFYAKLKDSDCFIKLEVKKIRTITYKNSNE